MLSKRSLGCDLLGVTAAKRLRLNVADLFLANEVSGARAASALADAHAAGASHVGDLQRLGDGKHIHRNLRTKLMKGSRWPKPYTAPVRVWNRRTEVQEVAMLPITLPHEVVKALISRSGQRLFDRGDGQDRFGSLVCGCYGDGDC